MPLNKYIIQDKELSIQIFKDGFSFCNTKARPFFKFENKPHHFLNDKKKTYNF